jgi:uncharacterized membrane protein (DUF4010 family)
MREGPSRRASSGEASDNMRTHEHMETKGAMSMLGLLLLVCFAIIFLVNPDAFKSLLKFLVIALILFAGLAVATQPHPLKPEGVSRDGAI